MKKKHFFLAILSLLILACSNPEKKSGDSLPMNNSSITKQINKSFSDPNSSDVFKITLTGNHPEETILVFTITNSKGKEIYNTKIKGTDLLGSTDPNVDLTKKKNQVVFIKNVFNDFLDEEHFLEPAIMPDQQADNYTPDKDFFKELKRSRLNGFTYRLGKENNIYIAWSEKDHKVKIYYNCC